MATTLPSGMVGEIRGLSGKDGRYLTNPEKVRNNEVDDFIFKNCWTQTIDAGPYSFSGDVDWSKVLLGDRAYLLVAVREETYPGDPYPMKVKCAACGKPVEWEIDIAQYLREKTKRMKPEHAKIFAAGNRFEEKFPYDGRSFAFRLKTGADSKRTLARLESQHGGSRAQRDRMNLMIQSLADSIIEINGVKDKYDARVAFLEDLPLRVIDGTMALVQEYDCGIETEISVACQRVTCGAEFEVELPFGQKAFFLPSMARARKSSNTPQEDPIENESTPDPFG